MSLTENEEATRVVLLHPLLKHSKLMMRLRQMEADQSRLHHTVSSHIAGSAVS